MSMNARLLRASLTIARSVGAAVSPALTGIFLSVPGLLSLPFLLGGAAKLLYDLLLYVGFRNAKPPEELVGAG